MHNTLLEAFKQLHKLNEAQTDADDDWSEDDMFDIDDEDDRIWYDQNGVDQFGSTREQNHDQRRRDLSAQQIGQDFINKYQNYQCDATLQECEDLMAAYDAAGIGEDDMPEVVKSILEATIDEKLLRRSRDVTSICSQSLSILCRLTAQFGQRIDHYRDIARSLSADNPQVLHAAFEEHRPHLKEYARDLQSMIDQLYNYKSWLLPQLNTPYKHLVESILTEEYYLNNPHLNTFYTERNTVWAQAADLIDIFKALGDSDE